MRHRTLIVGLVVLLAIGLVVPLVLMNVGGGHGTNGSGNRAGGSPQVISREWTSLQASGRLHWGFGHPVVFPARRVIGIPTRSGYRAELWVAPTPNGNFCTVIKFKNGEAAGCMVRAAGAVSPGAYAPGRISRECVLHGPYLVQAAVTDTRAEAVDLVYADGTRKRLRLVRVGRPINASFFLYELPRNRLASQTKPSELRVLDGRGKRLSETPFPFILSPATGCSSLS
jgi:hypothetical protein